MFMYVRTYVCVCVCERVGSMNLCVSRVGAVGSNTMTYGCAWHTHEIPGGDEIPWWSGNRWRG